jgi:Photoprotection regulator fluorescence recovery protein
MDNLKWSESEKKLSRRVFEAALEAELSEILAEFKSKAAAAATAAAMWALEEYLAQKRREVDGKYDYRYSQLLFVFGRLVREGRLSYIQRMQEL